MAKAKAKSKSSKVVEKVEVVKKSPPKPEKIVNPIEVIASSLEGEYSSVFSVAR